LKPVSIDVELMSNSALDEIFGDGSFIASTQDDVKLLRPTEVSHGFGLGELAAIVIDFGQHAPVDFVHAMAAAWLYEMFKNRARRVTYKGRNYRISEKDMEELVKRVREDAGLEQGRSARGS